jgi:hypothetical protein
MRIVVPSKNRIDYTIDKVLGKDMTLFLEPQDKEKYKERTEGSQVVIIPKDNMGFGYVLKYIVDWCYSRGERYILFADDDIFGLKRKDKKEFSVSDFLLEAEKIMKENYYAQLMISFSGHNWYYKERIKERIGAWGMVLLDLKQITEIGNYDSCLKIFSDWDISARLISKGKKVACLYDYMFLHKMKSKDGGAMEYYKNNNFMKVNCLYMKKKYREKVKIIFHKEHNQFEIRFNWKKL